MMDQPPILYIRDIRWLIYCNLCKVLDSDEQAWKALGNYFIKYLCYLLFCVTVSDLSGWTDLVDWSTFNCVNICLLKSLFSLSKPSWMASLLTCIKCLYLRHITYQPDHLGLLLFLFQELEHRLVSAHSMSLLQGYGIHCLLLYAQQPMFLLF